MSVDVKKLSQFLVSAKRESFASYKNVIDSPERRSHKEIVYFPIPTEYYYIDSWTGFLQFAGNEEVRKGGIEGPTLWAMSYHGGMLDTFRDENQANITYNQLRKALLNIPEDLPLRGPKILHGDLNKSFIYTNAVDGDITRFKGHEKIFFEETEVYNLNYIGGLVISK